MAKRTSCGVLVTDGECLLLGHATRSPRWDIPKGIAEPGEAFAAAAARELDEETGLIVAARVLHDLGVHTYMTGKALALFRWAPPRLPQPETLTCRSTFLLPSGVSVPEFDRFGVFAWDEALAKVGRNMARVLAEVRSRCSAVIE
jgi:8-oxo-dGTP pyrophosphatase MutT (NUDIX family)